MEQDFLSKKEGNQKTFTKPEGTFSQEIITGTVTTEPQVAVQE